MKPELCRWSQIFRHLAFRWLWIFFLCVYSVSWTISARAADPGSSVNLGERLANDLSVPKFVKPSGDLPFVLPVISGKTSEPHSFDSPKFFLKEARFVGNTLFTDDQLLLIAKPFLGKLVSTSSLEDLRLAISSFYAAHGYVNSGARLPDQKITDGLVRFQIIEGRLTDIRIKGEGWLWPGYISGRLYQDENGVLNTLKLQENFQLLLNDPLIERLNGALKPGKHLGEALLDLEVTRAKPYFLSVSFDNYHPPSSGSYEGVVDGRLHNLTRLGDELILHGEKTEGAWDISGEFAVPVTKWNTRLFVRYEESDSSVVEESLEVIDIESDYRSYEVGIDHPFFRTLSREFKAGLSFSSRQSKTWLLGENFPFAPGVESDGRAKTSVIRLTNEYSNRTVNEVLALRSTFGFGISLFDSTIHKEEADSRFVAWIGQGRYGYKLDEISSTLLLRADLQLSSDSLLPMERFAVGGAYSVRGYRENELVRDNGCVTSVELRYSLYGDLEKKDQVFIQLAPFLDGGTAWNHDQSSGVKFLASGGVGLILDWKGLHAECFLAYAFVEPVEKVDYDLQDSGVHFRLSWNVF